MAKCSKDYDPAIETFQKALTEHRNPDTLKKLNEAEKAKKDLEQQEYFDPKLADEEREKGITSFSLSLRSWFDFTKHNIFFWTNSYNYVTFFFYSVNFLLYTMYYWNCHVGNEFFKQQKYPEAVKHYTESIRRNPEDPRVIILFE